VPTPARYAAIRSAGSAIGYAFFDVRGGVTEEVPDRRGDEVFLARGDRIQCRLRALEPGGKIVHGQPGGTLGQHQVLYLAEQFLASHVVDAPPRPGRAQRC